LNADDTYGVLRLELLDAGYRWKFIPVAGSSFRDADSAVCRKNQNFDPELPANRMP
jgi:hypothetical protein